MLCRRGEQSLHIILSTLLLSALVYNMYRNIQRFWHHNDRCIIINDQILIHIIYFNFNIVYDITIGNLGYRHIS